MSAPKDKSKMDRQITIRCTGQDAAELERLHGQLPDLSLASVARAAMRLGLAALEGDAHKLIVRPAPSKPEAA